jgi:hypothetical protein
MNIVRALAGFVGSNYSVPLAVMGFVAMKYLNDVIAGELPVIASVTFHTGNPRI